MRRGGEWLTEAGVKSALWEESTDDEPGCGLGSTEYSEGRRSHVSSSVAETLTAFRCRRSTVSSANLGNVHQDPWPLHVGHS